MTIELRASARRVLPARLQDLCREALDRSVPARRRAAKGRRESALTGDHFAEKLSPTGTVLDGLFAGMVMPGRGTWGGALARLAGTYEEELVPYLRHMLTVEPSLVIDIGAADGYYAVGLARLLPCIRVLAYEIDADGRRACRQAVRQNGVTNVSVRGRMTPRELRKRIRPQTLILSDVEGYEVELLDPVLAPGLAEAYMIIELHEFAEPGVTSVVIRRFADSHRIHLVDAEEKTGAGRRALSHLTSLEADRVVDEGRPQKPRMQWAVLWPVMDSEAPSEESFQ